MKKIVILLGNGFSIDLISRLKKSEDIDLFSLFRNGDRVPWPKNDIPGFLAMRYCPNLWTLGARPDMTSKEANKLIEDIITCANFAYQKDSLSIGNDNIYSKAYYELVAYLRCLFIHYNNAVSDVELEEGIEKWGWSELFKNAYDNRDIESITFITYNYDVFLERILFLLKIPFNIKGLEKRKTKVNIIKPHGSISFRSKDLYDRDTYVISYSGDALGGKLTNLVLDKRIDYSIFSKINTMIPPAGDSDRYPLVWSRKLREFADNAAENTVADDVVFLGGLSYCSVDRLEIDRFLSKLNTDISINIVNPDINNTLCSVISSTFKKYIHYTSSNAIGGLFK